MNDKNTIPILSFYTGGGFMDMGFEMAGFNIIWSNEYDCVFSKLHTEGITSWRRNNGIHRDNEVFNSRSILNITSEEIIKEAFPDKRPPIFGMIGGPPCQDFSINGNMKGFNGDRGKLTIVFFDKIMEIMPTFFIMENVTGLIRNKSNNDYLNILINIVKKHYFVEKKILNALDFGVPQFRERVFIVGMNKNSINCKSQDSFFCWPSSPEYKDACKKFNWPAPSKYGNSPIKPKEIPLELCVQSCLIPNKETFKIPNANEYFNLYVNKTVLSNIQEGETNRPSFKRLHRFKYSPTACYGNNEVHLHPYENRRLSVREVLRIQGVPDSYVLPPGLPLSKKFKMIGNGVPVPLSYNVAKATLSFLAKNKLTS